MGNDAFREGCLILESLHAYGSESAFWRERSRRISLEEELRLASEAELRKRDGMRVDAPSDDLINAVQARRESDPEFHRRFMSSEAEHMFDRFVTRGNGPQPDFPAFWRWQLVEKATDRFKVHIIARYANKQFALSEPLVFLSEDRRIAVTTAGPIKLVGAYEYSRVFLEENGLIASPDPERTVHFFIEDCRRENALALAEARAARAENQLESDEAYIEHVVERERRMDSQIRKEKAKRILLERRLRKPKKGEHRK